MAIDLQQLRKPAFDTEATSPVQLPWRKTDLSLEARISKMSKNAIKAILEHRKTTHPRILEAYVTVEEAQACLNTPLEKPLSFTSTACATQSGRPHMEDAHFTARLSGGALAGVFDGHSGAAAAQLAKQEFESRFEEKLASLHGNVHRAFEELCHEIHIKSPPLSLSGTTAVVCYADLNLGKLYTCTLGDSEANCYRMINQKLKSWPVSCVRDWASPKDNARARKYTQTNNYIFNTTSYAKPYINNGRHEINVSRAIGDWEFTGTEQVPGIIHKPKITLTSIKPGDLIVLACDGLKDFVDENEIIDRLQRHPQNPAEDLVAWALKNQGQAQEFDNITVVALQIS